MNCTKKLRIFNVLNFLCSVGCRMVKATGRITDTPSHHRLETCHGLMSNAADSLRSMKSSVLAEEVME